ncbi:MAG: enolase C-terminal domain-like protein, partial [Candidatus Rokubacteria bacterium]|nr:enolase C-terminal domain-like protein [Candidatus Rokubacteria bacterium]
MERGLCASRRGAVEQLGRKPDLPLRGRVRHHALPLVGPDGDIMLDCYMALDVPYAIKLAKEALKFDVLWIEEPVPPDQIDSYRQIKDAVPDILVTAGEHEFMRYGFR